MIVSLSEEGGAAVGTGPRRTVLDLGTLDEEAARRGRALAGALIASAPHTPASNASARDAVEYTLTIEHEGRTSSCKADATSLTREFAELLRWFKTQAAARRLRDEGG